MSVANKNTVTQQLVDPPLSAKVGDFNDLGRPPDGFVRDGGKRRHRCSSFNLRPGFDYDLAPHRKIPIYDVLEVCTAARDGVEAQIG